MARSLKRARSNPKLTHFDAACINKLVFDKLRIMV
jgi:hypothetical protein